MVDGSETPAPAAGSDIAAHAARLRDAGAVTLIGTICDSSGVLRGKAVPAARIESFARSGMGASLTWPVFCVDNSIAMTEQIGVVGDLRLTADLDAAVVLEAGFGWAPADVRDQDGGRSTLCWRDVARRQEARLAEMGLSALVGHEMEFFLTENDGSPLGEGLSSQCYGLAEFSERSELMGQIVRDLDAAEIRIEQIHAEYGLGQFEISLPPRTPVRAADDVLLARTIIGRAVRRHDLRASFSPVPFEGGSGNGAHLHVSLNRDGDPLFSNGSGAHGLTSEGEWAVAGVIDDLPATIAVLAGTPVSGDRLHPGHWSGASACWGLENREAAIRLVQGNRGNPHGANIEVKCVDGGANTYLATGLVLGLMADGIERKAAAYEPIDVDPNGLDDAALQRLRVRPLPTEPQARIADMAESDAVRRILGDDLHAAIVAVRTFEAASFDGKDAFTLTRFAWSA